MPVANYSVLKGTPTAGKLAQGNSPHYQITVDSGAQSYTIAVNVQSTDGSEILYDIRQSFVPPSPDQLTSLAAGVTPLTSAPGGLALDYVREQINGSPMIELSEMTLLPAPSSSGNTLHDGVSSTVQQVIAGGGEIYAFGSFFADGGVTDGIHNIHMNQGNPPGSFEGDNGTWQDGALFLFLPAASQWTAIFLAFQTESWNTDDQGDPS